MYRRAMLANLMMAFALAALLIAIAFGWFFNWNDNDVSELGMSAVRVMGMMVSTEEDGVYSTELSLPGEPKDHKILTGNGAVFYQIQADPYTGEPHKETAVEITDVSGYDLYFKSNAPADIYLGAETAVMPENPEERKSTYGNFSTDYLAGAARVAFFDCSRVEQTPSFLWIPNQRYELAQGESGWSFQEDGSEESSYSYYNGTEFVTLSETTDFYWGAYRPAGTENAGPAIAKLTYQESTGDYRAHLHIVLWVEGTDREAKSPLAGGQFALKLDFVGVGREWGS